MGIYMNITIIFFLFSNGVYAGFIHVSDGDIRQLIALIAYAHPACEDEWRRHKYLQTQCLHLSYFKHVVYDTTSNGASVADTVLR